MSLYMRALLRELTGDEQPTWGWMITKDVDADKEGDVGSEGVCGPDNFPKAIEDELDRRKNSRSKRKGFNYAHFKLYVASDSRDEQLGPCMAHGLLIWLGDSEPCEEALAAPLYDYGQANWGCVAVEYPGHDDWAIG